MTLVEESGINLSTESTRNYPVNKSNRRKTIQTIAALSVFFFAVTMTDLARASVIFVSEPGTSFSHQDSQSDRSQAPSIFESVSRDLLEFSSDKISFNARGQVQSITETDKDGIPTKRDFIYLPSGELERVDFKKLGTLGYSLESAAYFTGPKGKEQPYQVFVFDSEGTVHSVYFFHYDSKTGALSRMDQRRYDGETIPLLTSTFYAGRMNQEKPVKIISYDSTGTFTKNRIDYVYNGTSLREIIQRKADDSALPIYSKTVFMGRAGQERLAIQFAYDEKGIITSRSDFFYNPQGQLNHSETREGADLTLPLANIVYFKGNLPFYSIALDPRSGNLLGRSEFVYDAFGALKQINLRDGDETTPIRNTTFVTEDLTGDMKIDHSVTYDKNGAFENRHDFKTDSDGKLVQVETRWTDDIHALRRIVIVFTENHGVNVPKYEVTLDSKGNVVDQRAFTFSSEDRLSQSDPERSPNAVLVTSNTSLLFGPPQGEASFLGLAGNSGIILKDHTRFVHDLQGVMNQIVVRAGPAGDLY